VSLAAWLEEAGTAFTSMMQTVADASRLEGTWRSNAQCGRGVDRLRWLTRGVDHAAVGYHV
jgi:hypothetical protein